MTEDLESKPSSMLAVTRDSLSDGSFLKALRTSAPNGTRVFTDEELELSLKSTLTSHDPSEDIYVFGYGSLMWNPAFRFSSSETARIHGWSRRFCLWMHMARGTPEAPGLMLALDRGGSCRGLVFRVAAENVREELQILWRREMILGSYEARWVNATVGGRRLRAITFVVNQAHVQYAGGLKDDQVAHFITTGVGARGTSAEYFQSTVTALHRLGIRDKNIDRLQRVVNARIATPLSQPGRRRPWPQ